jgi:type IV pilus assembly protein PilF
MIRYGTWRFDGTIIALLLILVLSGCITETNRLKLKADPEKSLQAHIDLGLGYLSKGELGRAKEKLARAMELDPKSALVHNAYGLMFQLEEESALAEKHYRRSIRLDSKFAVARNNYGAFLFSEGRFKEAIEQFKIGVKDPFYRARSQVYENLGICYLRTGEKKLAEEAFEHAISLNPRQIRSLLEQAVLVFERQDYARAQSLYRRHIGITEQSARSLWLGIRVERIFENRNEVASYALMLKNIFPASPEYKLYQESL